MIQDNPQKIKKSLGLKKTKSLKNVSLSDNKVSQGQGGANKKTPLPQNFNQFDLNAFEEQEEEEMRKQMEASNLIAMQLYMKQQKEKEMKDQIENKNSEFECMDKAL